MRKFTKVLLGVACVASLLMGCSKADKTENKTTTQASQNQGVSVSNTTEALSVIWNNYKDEKFPCFGGDISNPVDSAPGKVDITNGDVITYTLLIPDSIKGDVTEASTLIHYMNANTFTGAALKVKASDKAAFVKALKEGIMGTQFMCGAPDRLAIITADDYVIYAFGADDIVSPFVKAATDNIKGAKVEVNQLLN